MIGVHYLATMVSGQNLDNQNLDNCNGW